MKRTCPSASRENTAESRSQNPSSGSGRSAASTSARRRGWKLMPRTAARRTTARSRGSSASIRAMVAAPMLSGSSSRSPAAAAASRSRRNSGLPPDRATASSTTCGGTCAASGVASASDRMSSSESGPSSILDAQRCSPSPSPSPPAASWRVISTIQEEDSSSSASASNSAADAASIRCASSTSTIVGHDERSAQEAQHDLAELRRAGLGRQLRDLGGGRHLDVERDRDQRQPGNQVRVIAPDLGFESFPHPLGRIVPLDLEELAEQLAPGEVRRLPGDYLAGRSEHGHALAQRLSLRQQPRLAGAGLAHELDERPRAAPGRGDRRAQLLELELAADQRQLGADRSVDARARRRTDVPGLEGLGLALDRERPDLDQNEASARPAQNVIRGVDVPDRRLAHHPRRDIHGVAHHRVPPSVRGPDVAREHRAAVDAHPHGERQVGLDDLPQRQQHPLLVVADDARGAGTQPDLCAVRGDVRVEEGDLVALARLLNEPHELVQPARRGLRAPSRAST